MNDGLTLFIGCIVAIYGLLFGSFLNVLIYRIPRKENIGMARSKCTFCGHYLSAWDLVPLLSYLFLGGKCRYCRKKISFRYPFVELLNAVFYVLIFHFSGLSPWSIFYMILSSACIVCVFIIYDRGKKDEN